MMDSMNKTVNGNGYKQEQPKTKMGEWKHARASAAAMLLLLLCLNEIAHVNSQREKCWAFLLLHLLQIPPRLDPEYSMVSIMHRVLPVFLMSQEETMYFTALAFTLAYIYIIYGDRFTMNRQIQNFESTLNQYRTMMNPAALSQFLAKSIAVVALHSMGIRKLFIAGIGPLGCIPNIRAIGLAPAGRCMDLVNQMVGFFNVGLRSMVEQLNRDHPDSIFVYANTYHVLGDILNNPARYQFNVVDRACCGVGRNRGQISCLPLEIPCLNRKQTVFWDAFHPSESAIYVFAWRAVNGPQDDCYPVNLKQMALI
ncbi:GDSL esterase/lipase [Vigna angularis]|uniref:GDSL esterase/lipase n=1 Tax=Phaseolus angularis TaxID=3914 RepID=A0A8T0KEK1_PHAAN|nr:GDSL esterase/lipase [Vigna angularis]